MARETRTPHRRAASCDTASAPSSGAATRATVILLAVLATLLGLLGATAASSTAASASTRSHSVPTVTSAHPYSNPVWLPLHSGFGVDCAGDNPGCTSDRGFFSIDLIPTGQFGPHARTSHAKVYAMGAGVVHIGVAHGTSCGSTPVASFGTWIWIDHGSGVVSRYGHLSKILVKNGAHVAAGTPIGVVGDTGKAKNCGVTYTDFMVDHRGLANDNSYHFDSLRTCSTDGVPQSWPDEAATTKKPGSDVPVHFATWDSVPHGTQFPASSGDCMPGGAPATLDRPTSVRVTNPADKTLTVSWDAPAAGTRSVMLELSVWHGSSHSWARAHNEIWRSLPATATHLTMSGLMRHHTYRARVSFLGGAGSSRGSSWVEHDDYAPRQHHHH